MANMRKYNSYKLCVVIGTCNQMSSPFSLTADLSSLSGIFRSRSLLEMARISCRVSHSNTRHNSQMSCEGKKQTRHNWNG